MKKCFKCEETKPLSEFYKHAGMADGYLNKCKECARRDVRKNRAEKIEYYREYERKRGNHSRPGYDKEYREANPEKHRAQNAVNNAVRDGRLSKPDRCSLCGSQTKVNGHHPDYSKPLDVVWVCTQCHYDLHHPRQRK